MRKKNKIVLNFLIAVLLPFFSIGQMEMMQDSSQLLALETYLDWVRKYHPIAQQANLLGRAADANEMKARGALDPKAYTSVEQKSFDGKNYFTVGEGGLKIPTWLGVDFKAAYNWTNGIFLNPENNLPAAGQAIAGVSVPVLQGLQFDDRRAQIQQAQLFIQANEAERLQMINELLLAATEAYWNWTYANEGVKVFENAFQLAEQRLDLTRKSFLQGDKPAIDTLESFIQVQNRAMDLAAANVELQNELANLSNFLWHESNLPLTLRSDVRSDELLVAPETGLANRMSAILNSPDLIPELQLIFIKQQELEVKERLKREMLKPRLDVEFNFLGDGFDFFNTQPDEERQFNALLTENYKWGLEFEFPLFLRKERAGLELIRLEQIDTKFKLDNKQLSIQNKVAALRQELDNTFAQIELGENNVDNYSRLLAAEQIKFNIGESSIFLLNNREQKLIEAQLKLLKLKSKYLKLQAKIDAAVGQLR